MDHVGQEKADHLSRGTVVSRLNRRDFVRATAATTLATMTPDAFADQARAGTELIYLSAISLSKAIRAKEVSSEELVSACLARIEAVNPKINAVVTLAAERAISEAREADAELARGHLRGILHGVPMTIKDSFDTAGVVSTAGTVGRNDFVPKRDATVVARLRAAGAILLGKTNTPELTMSYDTRNLLFGFTKNPYDLSKSPGGSSGGAAAILAAGGSPLDMGSDTGGSIRVPSAFCGTAGIKPTTGRMPLTGHIICTGLGAVDPLTQVGPMARFVDDLFPLLQLTAGPDETDPATVPAELRHPAGVNLAGLRVAFHWDNGIIAASADVRRTIENAAHAISQLGARVEESRPKALTRLLDFLFLSDAIDGYDWLKDLLKQCGTEQWDPHIDWYWQSRPLSGKEAGRVLRLWQQFRIDMLAWMRRYDALLCPVYAQASLPSGFAFEEQTIKGFAYTAAYNYTGWPAAVVRCGTSDAGMPIGVQVVATSLARGRLSGGGETSRDGTRRVEKTRALKCRRSRSSTAKKSHLTDQLRATRQELLLRVARQ